MPARAFTSFGAGAGAEEAHRSAAGRDTDVAATSSVREVAVPAGANPSRWGTWVQRAVVEGTVSPDVPEEHRAAVEAAAGLLADPATCLAIRMEGDVGERMKARLGAGPGEGVYLLVGVRPEG